MPRRSKPLPATLDNWFLPEWMGALEKIQADLEREPLGYPKAKASGLFNRRQRYNQQVVAEIAAWLNIRPYELLMPPAEAMALRRIRADAAKLAADSAVAEEAAAGSDEVAGGLKRRA